MEQILNESIGVVVVECIIIFIGCINQVFKSDIEMLFMDKEDQKNRFLGSFILILFLCVTTNYLVTFNETCLYAGILGFFIFIAMKIYRKRKECKVQNVRVWTSQIKEIDIRIIMMLSPMVIWFIASARNSSLNVVIIIVSFVEILLILINEYIIKDSKKSRVALYTCDGKEKWYVYEKIDNEYIICGDAKIMKEADKIIRLSLEEINTEKCHFNLKVDE